MKKCILANFLKDYSYSTKVRNNYLWNQIIIAYCLLLCCVCSNEVIFEFFLCGERLPGGHWDVQLSIQPGAQSAPRCQYACRVVSGKTGLRTANKFHWIKVRLSSLFTFPRKSLVDHHFNKMVILPMQNSPAVQMKRGITRPNIPISAFIIRNWLPCRCAEHETYCA